MAPATAAKSATKRSPSRLSRKRSITPGSTRSWWTPEGADNITIQERRPADANTAQRRRQPVVPGAPASHALWRQDRYPLAAAAKTSLRRADGGVLHGGGGSDTSTARVAMNRGRRQRLPLRRPTMTPRGGDGDGYGRRQERSGLRREQQRCHRLVGRQWQRYSRCWRYGHDTSPNWFPTAETVSVGRRPTANRSQSARRTSITGGTAIENCADSGAATP